MDEPKGKNVDLTTLKIILKKKKYYSTEHHKQKEKANANFGGQ